MRDFPFVALDYIVLVLNTYFLKPSPAKPMVYQASRDLCKILLQVLK